ncbi:MAG: J domain-containing protein [Phycisphaerales bacterium]|nr:J domain-containing protein [Phycisphaerales bacterium]
MNLTDCYKVLGLAPGASLEDLHGAYKRLALRHHPDRANGDARSHRLFCQVTEAYATLKKAYIGRRGSEQLKQCECGETEDVLLDQHGRNRCKVCLLSLREKRLPMTMETVRCISVICLQLVAMYCLIVAVADGSVRAAILGLIFLLGSLAALTYNVLTSIIVHR